MLKCIVAVSSDGCIDVPTPKLDRDRFAMLTIGADCVCGRKTWDTLPPAARRNRSWTIFTRSEQLSGDFKLGDGPLPFFSSDLGAFIESHAYSFVDPPVWVCGGGQLYDEALPACQMLYLTRLRTGGGTIKFPPIDFDRYDRLFSRDFEDHVFEILRVKP